jgi:hypothetical protein
MSPVYSKSMDPLKEAFAKVREDIHYLYRELEEIKLLIATLTPTNQPTPPLSNTPSLGLPTNQQTNNQAYYGLKVQNTEDYTGNKGVPTNQQTNQQTNQHPIISTGDSVNFKESPLSRVSEILGTLDELKKEVRIKFKRLTPQEMAVYGAIYNLESQGFAVDYGLLSQHLGLTEISIRDYIRKILLKGTPLVKYRESNKHILLSVPEDLRKIASLETLYQLRNI